MIPETERAGGESPLRRALFSGHTRLSLSLLLALRPVTAPPAESQGDSLRLRVEVPASVRQGTSVPVTLRVENVSPRPVELYLRGRTIAFDVIVARAGGQVVWRRLDGAAIPAIVQLRVLAPGEALVLRATWDQRTGARGNPTAWGSAPAASAARRG